jgi:uncharacterized membrane-anchored protein
VQLFFTCLLYFTAFGSIFALVASVVSIVFWLLKRLVLWLIAEPETDASRSTRARPRDLAYLKRAGQ